VLTGVCCTGSERGVGAEVRVSVATSAAEVAPALSLSRRSGEISIAPGEGEAVSFVRTFGGHQLLWILGNEQLQREASVQEKECR
jgi:hypothetical protein